MRLLEFTFEHFYMLATYEIPEPENGIFQPQLIAVEHEYLDIWDFVQLLGAEAEKRIYDTFYKEYEESLKPHYTFT